MNKKQPIKNKIVIKKDLIRFSELSKLIKANQISNQMKAELNNRENHQCWFKF
jgi:hypothetical protein